MIGFIMLCMALYSHCIGFRIRSNLQKVMELLSFIVSVLKVFDGFELSQETGCFWFKVFQCSKNEKDFGSKKALETFLQRACSRTRVGVLCPLVVSLDGRMTAYDSLVEHFAQVGASPSVFRSWCAKQFFAPSHVLRMCFACASHVLRMCFACASHVLRCVKTDSWKSTPSYRWPLPELPPQLQLPYATHATWTAALQKAHICYTLVRIVAHLYTICKIYINLHQSTSIYINLHQSILRIHSNLLRLDLWGLTLAALILAATTWNSQRNRWYNLIMNAAWQRWGETNGYGNPNTNIQKAPFRSFHILSYSLEKQIDSFELGHWHVRRCLSWNPGTRKARSKTSHSLHESPGPWTNASVTQFHS